MAPDFKTVISKLIDIGVNAAQGLPVLDEQLLGVRHRANVNRQGKDQWLALTEGLTIADIENLLFGLTYVERELRWVGGSAAGSIWLFSILVAKGVSREELNNVSSWVLENASNPYNPFGTIVTLGAKNYSEFQELTSERNKRISVEVLKNQQFEEDARLERQTLGERRRYCSSLRKSEERTLLIERLNTLSILEQLKLMADDTIHLPNFYPTKIADSATVEVISSLEPEYRLKLACLLKGKQHGPWGSFKKRLFSMTAPDWDKKPWRV